MLQGQQGQHGRLSRLATSSAFLVTYGIMLFAMTHQMSPGPPPADRGPFDSARDAQQLANLANMALGVLGFMAQLGTLALGRHRWALLSVPAWALGSGVAGLLGVPLWRSVTAVVPQIVEYPSVISLLAAGVVAIAIMVTMLFELLRRLALNSRSQRTSQT